MKILVKIGGTLVDNFEILHNLAQQVAAVSQAGYQLVVVHGGGRQLTRFLDERGISSHFIGGMRVTSEPAMDAVLKIFAGSVNKQLVGALRAAGANPVGISGIDGRLTTASRMSEELGFVGRVDHVDPALITLLLNAGMVPVVACVAGDDQGSAWNINADQMAIACARALAVDRLIFLTDVPGVLDADGLVLPKLNLDQVRGLIESGVAAGGMQAKLNAASAAVTGGIPAVVIAPGAAIDIVAKLLNGEPAGTEIRH